MTTETILTDEQIESILKAEADAPEHRTMLDYARAIEQAVLQSPALQAMKRDMDRMYAALRRISDMNSMSYHSLDSAKITAKAALDQRK